MTLLIKSVSVHFRKLSKFTQLSNIQRARHGDIHFKKALKRLRQEDVEFENNLGYKLNSRPASVSNIIRPYITIKKPIKVLCL